MFTKTCSYRFVFAAFLVLVPVLLSGCDTSQFRSKDAILKAIADNTDNGLDIQNATNFDWHNITFTLEKTHSHKRLLLKSGEKIHIKYSEFRDPEGDPYPQGRVPSIYFIDADEGTGPA